MLCLWMSDFRGLNEPNAFVLNDLMVQKEHSELFKRIDTIIKDAVFGLKRIDKCLSIQQLRGKKSSEG